MELPDWCPPEVHNYKMLTIPATGRIATEPFFPADGPRDGVIVGLALDGKPIWSPNYQYDYGAYCDGGVITSILTDTCNEIMGLGYVKVGRLFQFFSISTSSGYAGHLWAFEVNQGHLKAFKDVLLVYFKKIFF